MGFLTVCAPDTRRYPTTRLWGIADGRGRTLYRKRFGFDAHNKPPQAKTQEAGETQRQPVSARELQYPGQGQQKADQSQAGIEQGDSYSAKTRKP